jgi:hypothetical protein
MLKVNVPPSPWSEQSITLAGIEYRFIFSFNERDQRWRLDIYVQDVPVIHGIKIMENQSFLYLYNLESFIHGDLSCIRMKKDNKDVGFDNFGYNKAYELIYFTNDEIINS